MYLSFVPGIFGDRNHPREIIHLTSQDGLKWEPKRNAATDRNGEGLKVIHRTGKYWLIAGDPDQPAYIDLKPAREEEEQAPGGRTLPTGRAGPGCRPGG
jgi:hypothetical protein